MTELRDARFKKALDEAPDAAARPAPAIAQSIRAAAHSAVAPRAAPVAPLSWWQRLWASTAQPRAPWNAAFATVLLAVLVTVLWVREPIPDAKPIASAPSPSAPAATGAPVAEAGDTNLAKVNSAVKMEVPAPGANPAPAKTPVPAPIQGTAPAPAPAPARAVAAPPVSELAVRKDAERKMAARNESSEVSAGAPAAVPPPSETAAPARGAAPAPASVLAEAPKAQSKSALPQSPMLADAAPPVLGASPALSAPAPMASIDSLGLQSWTGLRVEMEGRSVSLDRLQGRPLFARLRSLAARLSPGAAAEWAPPATQPLVRLTVLSQDQPLADMRLWQDRLQWSRPGQPDALATLAPADLETLLRLARQALAASPTLP